MREVRWVALEQIHLTLKFFGNVEMHQVGALQRALERAVGPVGPIPVSVAGFGCFPSEQRPSVIWLGLGGDLARLHELQKRIERETETFGSHSEIRTFHPHLTIGRIRSPGGPARGIGGVLKARGAHELGSWAVEELLLMRSQLAPTGSIHTTLAAFKLAGSSRG